MTRSQKKRAKNQRISIARGLDRMAKRINDTARHYANIITKIEHPERHLFNRLCKCDTCKFFYCLCFDGTIMFCVNCIWNSSCLKVLEPVDDLIIRECKECYWDRKEAENASLDCLHKLRQEDGV